MALYNPILGDVPSDNNLNKFDYYETLVPDKDNQFGRIRRALLVKDVTQLPLNAGTLTSITGTTTYADGITTPTEVFEFTIERNTLIKEILLQGSASFTPTTNGILRIYFNGVLAVMAYQINTPSGTIVDYVGYFYDSMLYKGAVVRLEMSRAANFTLTSWGWNFKGFYMPD